MIRSAGAGRLRRRLALLAPVDVPDGMGGATRTFQEIAMVWARVAPARVREAERTGRAVGLLTHQVTLRFREDVESGFVFADGARRYRILAVRPADERRRHIDCLVEEETP